MTANSSYPVNNIIIYVHFSQKAIFPIIIENGNNYYKFLKNCSKVTQAGYLFLLFISFERDNEIGIGHHCQSFLPQGRKFERTKQLSPL